MRTVIKKLEEELNFENLYNYFLEIYKRGEYRSVNITFTDWEGSEYITVSTRGLFGSSFTHGSHISMYKVMNGNNRMREENVVRVFDEDTITMEYLLDYFNKLYKNDLRKYHQVNN